MHFGSLIPLYGCASSMCGCSKVARDCGEEWNGQKFLQVLKCSFVGVVEYFRMKWRAACEVTNTEDGYDTTRLRVPYRYDNSRSRFFHLFSATLIHNSWEAVSIFVEKHTSAYATEVIVVEQEIQLHRDVNLHRVQNFAHAPSPPFLFPQVIQWN